MVEEARSTPKAQNGRALLMGGLFVLFGVVGFAASGFLPAYVGVVQAVSLFAAVFGVFTFTRYTLLQHSYVILRLENGERYFLVEQMQGKRKSTVFQCALSDVLAIYEYAEREKAETLGGRMLSYTVSYGKFAYQTVTCRRTDGRYAVRIEADEAFLSSLRQAVLEEKSKPTDEE